MSDLNQRLLTEEFIRLGVSVEEDVDQGVDFDVLKDDVTVRVYWDNGLAGKSYKFLPLLLILRNCESATFANIQNIIDEKYTDNWEDHFQEKINRETFLTLVDELETLAEKIGTQNPLVAFLNGEKEFPSNDASVEECLRCIALYHFVKKTYNPTYFNYQIANNVHRTLSFAGYAKPYSIGKYWFVEYEELTPYYPNLLSQQLT